MERFGFFLVVAIAGAFFGGFGVSGTLSAILLLIGVIQVSALKGHPAMFARRTRTDLVLAGIVCLVAGIIYVAIFQTVSA